MKSEFDISIQPVWHMVRELRERLGVVLANHSAELRVAAAMTASELVENAIKYGEAVNNVPNIHFSMWESDGVLTLQTVNGCTDAEAVRELMEHVQEISTTDDRTALYVSRLEQLLANPTESGHLGLYRISLEGQFDLHAICQDNVVTITATRSIQ